MTVTEDKRREMERLRGHGINPQRMIVRKGLPIAYIDPDTALDLIDREPEWNTIGGLFVVPDEWAIPMTGITLQIYEAIDNDSGDCFVEMFFHESAALSWLSDEYSDTDEIHARDAQRLDRELDTFCPMGHPDRSAVVEWIQSLIRAYKWGGQ